jgi:hypothetical protein
MKQASHRSSQFLIKRSVLQGYYNQSSACPVSPLLQSTLPHILDAASAHVVPVSPASPHAVTSLAANSDPDVTSLPPASGPSLAVALLCEAAASRF